MNPSEHLLNAYADWRKLTQTEGEAIRSTQWALVERCQQAKAQLQSTIVRLSESAAAQWLARGRTLREFELSIRDVINDLIELETANARVLAAARQQAESEFAATRQSTANLRNIRRGYGRTATSAWQSYC